MRKSFNIVGQYRGRGLKEHFQHDAEAIVEIETDDSSIGLGFQLPKSRSDKHIRVATCTNAAKYEWTVFDFFKPRIKSLTRMS